MIHLAYDGSINGDWVAWYAINLARHDPDRKLVVVHVETPEVPPDHRAEGLERVKRECQAADVLAEVVVVPDEGGVLRSLQKAVPAGAGSLLVCGTRVRGGTRGYLAGTVSEKLLKAGRSNVVALRVLQPGVLGVPHNFLMPVAGDKAGVEAGIGLLRLFAPDIRHLQLLRVMAVKHLLFRRLRPAQAARLMEKGEEALEAVEAEMEARLGLGDEMVDTAVAVSDDWAHETLIAANRHKVQLICVEAARHFLSRRFFYGNPLEVVLRDAPCDVAVYRGAG